MPSQYYQTLNKFKRIFKSDENVRVFFAPGRVNLIGEHTDYNGGMVLPIAIERGTVVAVREKEADKANVYSDAFNEKKSVALSTIDKIKKSDKWLRYFKAVLAAVRDAGYNLNGMELFIGSTLPHGAGLSSSASFELALANAAILTGGKKRVTKKTLIKLCVKAENEYAGVQCGILDQFSCAMGKAEHAILLNVATMEDEYIPIKMSDYSIVVVNSAVKRELAGSEYNVRRSECESALVKLNKKSGRDEKYLSGYTADDLDFIKKSLRSKELKRARFIVEENARVVEAAQRLKENDFAAFGKLLSASHKGLSKDYEVSCTELDTLVDISLSIRGVLGAKMTGAGFGGCIVAVVPKRNVENYIETVYSKYKARCKKDADFYVVKCADGVREIKN